MGMVMGDVLGGSVNGRFHNGGWGGDGGDDNGDDKEEDEFGPILKFEEVIKVTEDSPIFFPLCLCFWNYYILVDGVMWLFTCFGFRYLEWWLMIPSWGAMWVMNWWFLEVFDLGVHKGMECI